MMPRAGGQYVFLREAYSPLFGFLFGWAMFLVVQTGTIAAVSVAFAKFLGVFWPQITDKVYLVEPIRMGSYALSLSYQQLVALVLIVFLTAVNMCGLKLGKWIQNSFTFTKTAALLGLVVLGLALGAQYRRRSLDVVVVGLEGQRLGPGHGFARLLAGRPAGAGDAPGPGHDRAVVLAVGLE